MEAHMTLAADYKWYPVGPLYMPVTRQTMPQSAFEHFEAIWFATTYYLKYHLNNPQCFISYSLHIQGEAADML